jgi:ABC-type transporter Mla subunit MlaD
VAAREVTVELRYRGTVANYSVKNISTGGMLVAGARSLPRGAAIDVELQLKGVKPVQAVGKVLYEIPEGMGVSFQPFTSDVALAMEKFIAAVDARNAMPPPLPSGPRSTSHDELPPVGPRPTEDPFLEGTNDPRPPRAGSPDERAEYLRQLLKNREEALKRGKAMLAALAEEADAVRAVAARFKSKLDMAAGQQQLNEAALAAARKAAEQQMESQLQERADAEARMEGHQRELLEAIGAVSGLEAKLRRQDADVARAKEQAEAAKREAREFAADAAGLRKAREELASANKKAMEAQAAANKEKTDRAAMEAKYADLRGAYQQLNLERTALKEEVQKLKAKLIAAENALERLPRKPAAPARR